MIAIWYRDVQLRLSRDVSVDQLGPMKWTHVASEDLPRNDMLGM
jgi:hypothetical protein